jgi:hypothetical protein
MNAYLTIMVTVLVATQIIRITQNAISLHRQNQSIKRDMGWLKDHYVTEQDFENQRAAFRLIREYLEAWEESEA